jgi:hypothetical protein
VKLSAADLRQQDFRGVRGCTSTSRAFSVKLIIGQRIPSPVFGLCDSVAGRRLAGRSGTCGFRRPSYRRQEHALSAKPYRPQNSPCGVEHSAMAGGSIAHRKNCSSGKRRHAWQLHRGGSTRRVNSIGPMGRAAMEELTPMKATELAAWVGATTGQASLWNIYTKLTAL